jgi:hypothetical protein
MGGRHRRIRIRRQAGVVDIRDHFELRIRTDLGFERLIEFVRLGVTGFRKNFGSRETPKQQKQQRTAMQKRPGKSNGHGRNLLEERVGL